MADIFRGRIIDVTDKTYTIELTGAGYKLDAFLEALDKSADSGNGTHRCIRHRARRQNIEIVNLSCEQREAQLTCSAHADYLLLTILTKGKP